MLYFNSPAQVLSIPHVTGSVSVYPDHEDPLTWYYLPMYPRVTCDDAGTPQLVLTKYASNQDSFALLSLDVNLGLSAEELKACKQKLQQQLSAAGITLNGEVTLQPATPKSGSVELMLLGRKSAGATLVKGISQAAAPALYNDNRAVFSVLLDTTGSDIVEASLTQPTEQSAVAVLYSLAIDGLRPAYNLSAKASWQKIHDALSEKFTQDGIFTGVEIASVIDKLKDSQVIQINVDNLQSDDQTSAVQAMMGQVRAMIFEQFFKPAPEPEKPGQPSFLSGLADLAKGGAAAAATGGLSLLGKFSWSKEQRSEQVDKTLVIDLSERSVTTMKVYPQAFLANLAEGTTGLVREVDGGQPGFFTSRTLTVELNQALADDGVASVTVDLVYANKRQSLLFRKDNDQKPQQATWTSSRDSQDALVRDVQLSFTVNFAARPDGSVPATLRSAPQLVTGDYITVAPRSLYSIDTVSFFTPTDFNWAQYPVITLACHYEDKANNIVLDWKKALSQKTSATWSFLRTDPARTGYRYRVGYQQAGGRTVELDWVASDLPTVLVSPSSLNLTIYPPKLAAWPAGVNSIQLDLTYDDPANAINVKRLVRFEAGQEARQLQWLVADPSRRTIGYTVTCIGERSASGPPSRTRLPAIALAAPLAGHTFVTVKPAQDLFANGKVTKVVAKLRHVETGQAPVTVEQVFRPGDMSAFPFEYDFVSDPACRCKLVYSFADGPPLTTPERDISGSDDFVISQPRD